MSEKERFLEALEAAGGNFARAVREGGFKKDTVMSWRRRDREFGHACERLMHRRGPAPVYEPGEVPDFLTWREKHCAYLVDKDGEAKVQRARNFWFQHEAVKALEENDRLIMVLPPGHLKTTLFGIEYPTWRIMRDRNFRCLTIRANENVAQDNTAAVAVRLSDSVYYADLARRLEEQGEEPIVSPIEAYGGEKGFQPEGRKIGDRWAGGEFTVSGRTSGEKDATMKGIGMDGSIPGYRADLIVIDDPQDPTKFDASGVEYSNKLMKKFRRDILGRILPGGKIVILANRLGPDDFIGQLIETYGDNPRWKVIYFPAIQTRLGKEEPLCPEVFSLSDLMERREDVGEDAWAFHYMQEETNERGATFTREGFELNRDWDRDLGDMPAKASRRIMGVDPAVSGYSAFVVLGVDPASGTRYLIDFENLKGLRTEDIIVSTGVNIAVNNRVQHVVVEVRNIQGSIYQKFKTELAKHGIRCSDYKTYTSTGAQAEEKDFDITSIGTLVEQGLFRIPYAAASRTKVDEYVTQMVRWKPRPPGKSSWHLVRDLVMATLFAESEARKYVKDADRGEKPVRSVKIPSWAKNRGGGWAWQRTG